MSPICPRCGDTMVEEIVWIHEHADKARSCNSYSTLKYAQDIPPTDGRESGVPEEHRESGPVSRSESVVAAANPVRRFFAGSCRKCGDHVYLAWEPNEHQFDKLLCTSCWMEAHPRDV